MNLNLYLHLASHQQKYEKLSQDMNYYENLCQGYTILYSEVNYHQREFLELDHYCQNYYRVDSVLSLLGRHLIDVSIGVPVKNSVMLDSSGKASG